MGEYPVKSKMINWIMKSAFNSWAKGGQFTEENIVDCRK